jgi:hypothetical protein
MVPLNPITSLPLFAAFSLLPVALGKAFWLGLNSAADLALVVLAWRALAAQSPERVAPRLPAPLVGNLAAVVVWSYAVLLGTDAGQLCTVTALALLAALECQGRGRPVLAGVFLALATWKTSLSLPFLLLRRGDVRTWVAMVVASLALVLSVVRPGEIVPWTLTNFHAIGRLSAPGEINNYEFGNLYNVALLGLDYGYYCLGLRDRSLLRLLHLATVGLLGLWLTIQVVGRRVGSRDAACSLVALYSLLFLYHRVYDAVILVLPLVYLTRRAIGGRADIRNLAAWCVVALTLVMDLPLRLMFAFRSRAQTWASGQLIGALLLPYSTWLILAVLLGVWTIDRRERSPVALAD